MTWLMDGLSGRDTMLKSTLQLRGVLLLGTLLRGHVCTRELQGRVQHYVAVCRGRMSVHFNSQLSYNIFPGMAAACTAMSQITNLSHNLYVSISDWRLLGFLNFQDALDEATCHDLTVSCISPLFSLRIMRCLIIPGACCLGRTKTQHLYQYLPYYMVCYFVQNLSDTSTACPNQPRVTWVVEQKGSSARAHT